MIEAENGDSCGISEQGETPHGGGGSPLAPRKASVRSGNQHKTLTELIIMIGNLSIIRIRQLLITTTL